METYKNIEDVFAGVELILESLGFPRLGLTDGADFYATLSSSLEDCDSEIAERLLRLGEKVADGLNPKREISKLRGRLKSSTPPQEISPNPPSPPDRPKSLRSRDWRMPETVSVLDMSSRKPWAHKNELARSRLPDSGGIFSRALRGRSILRGHGRHS